MVKRIAITGPESTGKTELAQHLAKVFNEPWVPEFARDYLEIYGPEYSLRDVEIMAKGQLLEEDRMAAKANRFLFCDTDFTVLKIWCEVVFGKCPDWIDQMFRRHRYDLYLLCYPDLIWQPDPLRENPDNRLELFLLYQKALEENGVKYVVVDGLGTERMEKAISFVKHL